MSDIRQSPTRRSAPLSPTPARPAPLRRGATALAVISLATACSGAGSGPGALQSLPGADYPLTVSDCGTEIVLNEEPQRVLTIGTAAVELLDAAGAADRIVARSGEFNAPLPPGLDNPPSDELIVDPADPSTEAVLAQAPDLVLGYGLFNADADRLAEAGISVLTVQSECGHDGAAAASPTGVSSIADDVRRLGRVFSTQETAEASAAALEARIDAAARQETGASAAWVYYFSSEDTLSAYGGRGLSASVLSEAGLSNVYGDQDDAYLSVSVESLLQAQPHWIVLSYGLYGESAEQARAAFLSEPGVDALEAVGADRIVMLPASASGSGPGAVEGLEMLVEATAQ